MNLQYCSFLKPQKRPAVLRVFLSYPDQARWDWARFVFQRWGIGAF